MIEKIRGILSQSFSQELVDQLLEEYLEAKRVLLMQRNREVQLYGARFVETVRRILEERVQGQGNYTPLGQDLPGLNTQALAQYEGAQDHDAIRFLIPRLLFPIYTFRNKRNVNHLGAIAVSQMDARAVMRMMDWILAEFVRLCHTGSPHEYNSNRISSGLESVGSRARKFFPKAWTIGRFVIEI